MVGRVTSLMTENIRGMKCHKVRDYIGNRKEEKDYKIEKLPTGKNVNTRRKILQSGIKLDTT